MSKYRNVKVVVLGDHMVDHYLFCKPHRISQEAPVLIVKKKAVNNILGGASNVAVNMRKLGAQVYVAGIVGNDYFGSKLKYLCSELGINTAALFTDQRPTTTKTRVIADDRQLLRYDAEVTHKINPEQELRIYEAIKNIDPDILVLVDYDKGCITPNLVKLLTTLSMPIFVNCKPENIECYKGVHTLIGNDYEITKALDSIRSAELFNPQPKDLIGFLGCSYLLHTHGDRGLDFYSRNDYSFIRAHKVTEIDCTGASDTVISVLALESLFSTMKRAAEVANYAASVVVTKFGTQPITYQDVHHLVESHGK